MIEYEFNQVVVYNGEMEYMIGNFQQIEPILKALPQFKQPPKRRYRRKKKIMVGDLIDEFMDDISAE